MKIIFYSSQYPRPGHQYEAAFSSQLVDALHRHVSVEVICPLPWFPRIKYFSKYKYWYDYATVPKSANINGIPVTYPKYLMIPKISGLLQPFMIFLRTLNIIRKLKRTNEKIVLNGHWIYPDGIAAVLIGKLLNIPVVLTALGSDINEYTNNPFRRRLIRWSLRHADYVTGVSSDLKDKMIKLGADSARASHIPNGVNINKFSGWHNRKENARTSLGITKHNKILLYVGRLSPEKGVTKLISALVILKNAGLLVFHTIILGDGILRTKIEDRISTDGLQSAVTLVGSKPHDEIPTWMASADVLVLPSLTEGMPNVILEAHATGLPTVASNVGGLPEMIIENVTGLLAKPDDGHDLSDRLQQAFKMNWDHEKIRESVAHMTWDAIAMQYTKIYQAV